tara:strand:+ start:1286 stop:2368 length:1083 start_codon:yes stop_codon:yes gene_type:complete
MTELHLTKNQYLEVEKLSLGAFAPLSGFMNEEQFHNVVDDMRLPTGDPFPLPVVLDLAPDDAERIAGRPSVALVYEGEEIGTLNPESRFTCDRAAASRKIFGTDDSNHPGVNYFCGGGGVFVGGAVSLTRRVQLEFSEEERSPAETRALFASRGWKRIVGFQTRNVPHRAHEYLQRVALETVDGLFVQPLVGRKKKGDYTPEAILAGYRALIDSFYQPDRVVFGILSTWMRYAGPREAVFHAIIRRNYGCTHFIVGRDHAGVGDYYGKYDAHELTKCFDGELGIEVVRLKGPYYCRACDGIVTEQTCPHEETMPDAVTHISGTDIRAMLVGGRVPEPHLIRPEIIAALDGVPLFVEEDDA